MRIFAILRREIMVNEERLMILKMVSEGKLTPEQAESLLHTLDETSQTESEGLELDVSSIQRKARGLMENAVKIARKQARELRKEVQKLHSEAYKVRQKAEHKERREVHRKARDEARQTRTKIVVEGEIEPDESQCDDSS